MWILCQSHKIFNHARSIQFPLIFFGGGENKDKENRIFVYQSSTVTIIERTKLLLKKKEATLKTRWWQRKFAFRFEVMFGRTSRVRV